MPDADEIVDDQQVAPESRQDRRAPAAVPDPFEATPVASEEPVAPDAPEEATPSLEQGSTAEAAADGAASDVQDGAVEPAPATVYELDEVLAASESVARAALTEITPPETIGALVATVAQGEHVVSLQFANRMRGYPGWLWTATLSRIDENEAVNVLEVELLPSDGAVLAPDWVPWSVRLADYRAAQEAAGEEFDESVDDETDEDEDSEGDDSEDEDDSDEGDSDEDDSDEGDSDEDDSDEDDSDDDDDDSDEDDSDDEDSDDDDSDDDR